MVKIVLILKIVRIVWIVVLNGKMVGILKKVKK